MRWFKEFLRPALRCARVGHDAVIEFRRGYMPAERYRDGVADSVRQERPKCTRCNLALAEWQTVKRRPLSSLSGSEGMWDAIEAGGYWNEHGTVFKKTADGPSTGQDGHVGAPGLPSNPTPTKEG